MKGTALQKLVFVYNADLGFGASLLDAAHKILSPSTYKCQLCELTFDALTEKRSWKKFRKTTDIPMQFLHRDAFKKQYASKFGYAYTFPIVLNETSYGFEVFIKTEELNAMKEPEELISLIRGRQGITEVDS